MIVRLVVTFSLLAGSVGQYVITCSSSSGKAGSNVTVLCKMNPPVNLSAETLDFKRIDSNEVVHPYRHYKDDYDLQAHQYRNRTALNHADLSRGFMTLNISPVKQSDKGPFKVSVPGLMAACIFHIDVERNQLNKTIRNNVSTTEPTEITVIESYDHDAAMKKVGIPIACILAAGALIFLLVKYRKTLKGMLGKKLKRNKGGTKEEIPMTQKEEIKADADNLRESLVQDDPSSS